MQEADLVQDPRHEVRVFPRLHRGLCESPLGTSCDKVPSKGDGRAPQQEVLSPRLTHGAEGTRAVGTRKPLRRSNVLPSIPPFSGFRQQLVRQSIVR